MQFSASALALTLHCRASPEPNILPSHSCNITGELFSQSVSTVQKALGILVEPETEAQFHRLSCCHPDLATELTIAASHDVKVQLRVLGIEAVESLYEVPEFTGDLPLAGDITMGIGHVGEPGICWLVDVQQVGS